MSTHRRQGSLRSSACPVAGAMRDLSVWVVDARTMTDVSCQKNGRGFGERRFCRPIERQWALVRAQDVARTWYPRNLSRKSTQTGQQLQRKECERHAYIS